MKIRRGIGIGGLIFAVGVQFVAADTFMVTNTSDSGDGSLRKAITDANQHPNLDANTPDFITFAIPGAGVHSIAPSTALPAITEPVVIDGYTQPGTSPNTLAVGDDAVLLIELNGANTSGQAIGLDITGGESTVRGLVVNRFGTGPNPFFGSGGIRVASDNNVIAGNFFGCNAAGNAAAANFGFSVHVSSGANNRIGGTAPADRNLLAGDATLGSSSGTTGLQISTPQGGTLVQGNYIGTNAAGTASLGNGRGIDITGTGANSITIGGLAGTPGRGAGNVISGNSSNSGFNNDGIYISNRPGDLTIQGNLIGLTADGSTALPNGVSGINIQDAVPGASTLLVGGTAVGARNVIFNNRISGIVSNALGLTIQGNFIGTEITGMAAAPGPGDLRGGDAIVVGGVATIGGSAPGAGNVIAGSGRRLRIFGGTITVQGNYIGTAVDGATAIEGNVGVRVENDAVVTIGGTGAGQGNIIANNILPGIAVRNTAHVTILGNSMYNNGFDPTTIGYPGIDLNDDGITPNDTGDPDAGPNNLQNYPLLKTTTITGGSVQIVGSLNSTPNITYRLEFFGNDQVARQGFGEGKYMLGFASVTTDGSGNATFDVTFPAAKGAAHVTATATDPVGNTSEFSAAIGQLLNISTRLRVQTGDNVLIGGFIISGTDPKKVMVRGIGPSLTNFGIQDPLADPILELHDNSTTLETNDDWKLRSDGSSQQAEIEATTLAPGQEKESAIVRTLPAGASYTAVVRGKNNTTGVGVVEAYDLDQAANSKLVNISTRGLVESGDNVLIGGFIVGNGLTKVIVRAIGPTLSTFGISNPLLDPTLAVVAANGTPLATNDDWETAQKVEIQGTGLAPNDSRESAIVTTLAPGSYTAIVRGKNGEIGIAVVEAYNIP
ncbi:MAG TPA: hypothetical protein VM940_00535 [Chthoniobacterales bacterium]|jgi:hypothetical protein|nr:hypothetical protein [Chthoniobacterales bacterium]